MSTLQDPSISGMLFVTRFSQCGCEFTNATEHWGLFLQPWDRDTGFLFHVQYSSNDTISTLMSSTIQYFGGQYPIGVQIVPGYRPGRSAALRGWSPVSRNIRSTDIIVAGQRVDEADPYNISSNNCQNWVIKVLEILVHWRQVSQDELDSLRARVPDTIFTSNW
jgi:hypothetical protein